MKKACLLLADGTLFSGYAVGADGCAVGEVVFNTGMAGYQEVLTDPSYYGQTVCMTYPLIGNYGINFEDYESRKSWVSGFVMRELCEYPSNWRCKLTLGEYLKHQNVVGIAGIDTRALTRRIRNAGVMNGIIYSEGFEPDAAKVQEMKNYSVRDAVRAVSCSSPVVYPPDFGPVRWRVALYDFGVKYNIERELRKRGCEVTVVPALTPPEALSGFDGVMLSNGPGDPAENIEIIDNLRRLLDTGMPVFGICLGHQLLALAIGAKTEKLRYGHRGVNHPVKDLDTGRTYITSQNHGYAVVSDSVPAGLARVRYVNLNDGTAEGLEYPGRPVFTVQYHPEVCPGPMDTAYLFDRFVSNMEHAKGDDAVCR
ncbi:MAG: glutamine-hydrolyzing carbamoyl-phosphate synthase small subunit [Clostridiaceae bacterium]|nr:glutamine-hydrolyzing carbamoyl-phosphate synthase small subunit [Clostridiaceae bacterium]